MEDTYVFVYRERENEKEGTLDKRKFYIKRKSGSAHN